MIYLNTIRKYTLALLETFSNIKLKVNSDSGQEYKKVPIKYSSREKINQFDEAEEKAILSGNYNVLPKISLSLSAVTKNFERQTNKYLKIATSEFGDFFFNASSFDFSYTLVILCRGMNEASIITEQIISKFNPTYTIRINEIPNQKVPTSVPIQLLDVSIETQEYEEISTNIVTCTISLMLKGNFYSPIEHLEKIKHFSLYMNLWNTSENNDFIRASYYDFDVSDSIVQMPEEHILSDTPYIAPIILDIESDDSIEIGKKLKMICKVQDYDNKLEELTFTWDVDGNATIISDGSYKAELIGDTIEVVTVKVICTDVHNNTSNMFFKEITLY